MRRKTGLCTFCEHFDAGSCAAYPDGIPEEILYGGYDHREPAPGDQGILFEPARDIAPEVIAQRIADYERAFGNGAEGAAEPVGLADGPVLPGAGGADRPGDRGDVPGAVRQRG